MPRRSTDSTKFYKQMKKFFITTPIYYANAQPHLGHAYTTVIAEAMARWQKEKGREVFLLTGTDEHGDKIAQKAASLKKKPQELVDEVAVEFKNLWQELGIDYQSFIRTTDIFHQHFVQAVAQKLYNEGYIYAGEYSGLYCLGCEQFKSQADLVEGKCPDHQTEPIEMKEKSYLLKMSDQQEWLIDLITRDHLMIRPADYRREILSFLEQNNLEDVSVSRQNVQWGIPFSFAPEQTIYVWFDAFLSYLSGVFSTEEKEQLLLKVEEADWLTTVLDKLSEKNIWPPDVNLIGKDILRVHATIWPIMLKYLDLPLPELIFTHGHLLVNGQKMSKSIGNVVTVQEMLDLFGREGTKYLLLTAGNLGKDVDIAKERLIAKYNADLANSLGNLLSRTVVLLNKLEIKDDLTTSIFSQKVNLAEDFIRLVDEWKIKEALDFVWQKINRANKFLEETKPWTLTDQAEREKVMSNLLHQINEFNLYLKIFLPETQKKISRQIVKRERVILFPKI